MDIIKKKIFLEEGISRNNDISYGMLTATTFNMFIELNQTLDDIGLFTDYPFYNEIVDYSILIDKLTNEGLSYPFMTGATPPSVILSGFTKDIRLDNSTVNDWYYSGDTITAYTESRLVSLKSYNKNNRYIVNFDIEKQTYQNFNNQLINGVTRITNIDNEIITYTFDTNDDINIGTINQFGGLLFEENMENKVNYNTKYDYNYNKNLINLNLDYLSKVIYQSEGWNNTNTSLSALTKEEYLLGIINSPEVFSDVFIDRGETSVLDKHLRISEINSLDHLEWYGNGYYNINKK